MDATILLIDDDAELRKLYQMALTRAGYTVKTAANGREGITCLYAIEPDLVILDIMMPEMNGWTTCQRIRELTDVPIIMLTAVKGQQSLIKGLDMGADDYLSKPVSLKTLEARIRVLLRRRLPVAKITIDQLTIDLHKRRVFVEEQPVSLSATEFQLLEVLAKNKGRVLTYNELLEQVWDDVDEANINNLRTFIGYLRRKLEKEPDQPQLIQTEWGIGYRLG